MGNIYENIEESNPSKEHKIFIVFHDMIVDVGSNPKLNPIVTELFIRYRKIKNFSCFYYAILYPCTKKKSKTQFYTLLYY